jgi:two-component system, cell cycle response regulator DivK
MSKTPYIVLIVEDNALNLELATDLLTAAGYSIREARTGEEGVRVALDTSPNLILMDLRLPGMDGFAALRQLKANPRTDRIPVVALTAQAMRGDEEAVLAAGFDDYICKPINTATFYKTIARLLGESDGGSNPP